MRTPFSAYRSRSDTQFNMTPMIDVVFLLIIFFMLICQFIVQENYRLYIPDDCPAAVVPDHLDENAVTVSVYPRVDSGAGVVDGSGDLDGEVMFAVRSRRFDPRGAAYAGQPGRLVEDMAERIGEEAQKKQDALVHLRADKDLTYGQVQKALLALSRAGIRQVQLAAFRSSQEYGGSGDIE